jgi:hypothetical protein
MKRKQSYCIYSWDSAYNPYAVQPDGTVGGPNYDYCETYVLVQAHNDCDDGPVLAQLSLVQIRQKSLKDLKVLKYS